MSAGAATKPKVIPVFVVVPPRSLLMDIAGPMEVLRYANEYQNSIVFQIRFVSVKDTIVSSVGLQLSGLEPLPCSLPDDAWVVVSGSTSRADEVSASQSDYKHIVDWMTKTVSPSNTLITICSGALLAAKAGLFNGKSCTSHFDCIDELKKAAVLANVQENRLFISDGNCHSSAGISTGVDLMLHLVAQITNHSVTTQIAKTMVVYMRRSTSDPQLSPWVSGRNHLHPAIHRVQDAVMSEPDKAWTQENLAAIAYISQRHLSRLFKESTGMSLVDYVNLMRINLVHDILRNSCLDMETIAERAGFSSTRHMRRIWQLHYPFAPSTIRKQRH